MNDPRRDEEPQVPEDAWLRERYPAASADFVEQTLARVSADQAQIDADAHKVDEIQFDPVFLEHLAAPAASRDFVDRTLAKVMAWRQQRDSRDRALEHLVHEYTVPPVSEDFVRRTLSALGGRAEGSALRSSAFRFAAAAALLLAAALVLAPLLMRPPSTPAIPERQAIALPTPVRFGSIMAQAARLRGLREDDELVTLAHLVSRRGE